VLDARRLVRMPELAGVRDLELANAGLGNPEINALVESPHTRRLVALRLGTNYFHDDGVAHLAGAFPPLETLDLSSVKLSEIGARALAGAAFVPRLTHLSLANALGTKTLRAFVERAPLAAGALVDLRRCFKSSTVKQGGRVLLASKLPRVRLDFRDNDAYGNLLQELLKRFDLVEDEET
jgi:hypothetical protein